MSRIMFLIITMLFITTPYVYADSYAEIDEKIVEMENFMSNIDAKISRIKSIQIEKERKRALQELRIQWHAICSDIKSVNCYVIAKIADYQYEIVNAYERFVPSRTGQGGRLVDEAGEHGILMSTVNYSSPGKLKLVCLAKKERITANNGFDTDVTVYLAATKEQEFKINKLIWGFKY